MLVCSLMINNLQLSFHSQLSLGSGAGFIPHSNVGHHNALNVNARTGKETGTRTALKPMLIMRWTTTEKSREMLSVAPPHIPSKKVYRGHNNVNLLLWIRLASYMVEAMWGGGFNWRADISMLYILSRTLPCMLSCTLSMFYLQGVDGTLLMLLHFRVLGGHTGHTTYAVHMLLWTRRSRHKVKNLTTLV